MLNNKEIGYSFPGTFLFRYYERLIHWWNSNSKKQAKKNIFYHYDLGNEFYSRWLDKSMTYSSALFNSDKESLEKAQENRYSNICNRQTFIETYGRMIKKKVNQNVFLKCGQSILS